MGIRKTSWLAIKWVGLGSNLHSLPNRLFWWDRVLISVVDWSVYARLGITELVSVLLILQPDSNIAIILVRDWACAKLLLVGYGHVSLNGLTHNGWGLYWLGWVDCSWGAGSYLSCVKNVFDLGWASTNRHLRSTRRDKFATLGRIIRVDLVGGLLKMHECTQWTMHNRSNLAYGLGEKKENCRVLDLYFVHSNIVDNKESVVWGFPLILFHTSCRYGGIISVRLTPPAYVPQWAVLPPAYTTRWQPL